MAAIVGPPGCKPRWPRSGAARMVALANKEALVCAGPL